MSTAALAREVEQALAMVVVPHDAGLPVRAAVGAVHDDAGRLVYRAYWDYIGGREYFGPHFDYPRECIAFVDVINEVTPISD